MLGAWVASNPQVQTRRPPERDPQLVEHDFADYYSENPAASFAGHVWINNAWVSAQVIIYAILLGLPIPCSLVERRQPRRSAGLMASHGKPDIFFGLIPRTACWS